ncbi:MAG: glycosyltransferase [Verrucomicrobiales bacterium]|nr:glycosyltransferase [Verrucomicrobiales bacterium]
MRVLHVIPSLAPCHGGPSVVLPVMERALTREGVEVVTVTTDDDGPGRRNGLGDGEARSENGVVRRYFRKQTEFYKVSLPLAGWLRRHVRDFDVVHVHALFSHASVAACRAAAAAGVPYVIRPLGVLNQYGVRQRRAFMKRFCLRWIDGPLVRGAAAVHFTAEAEREEAEMLGIPLRSRVVPLGLEFSGIPEAGVAVEPVILFLSRIDPVKNIETLLRAWAGVADVAEGWTLVVAGSGEASYVASLQALARELGVGERTSWPGHVAGVAKSRLQRGAAVFVLPSFSENFGIAAAEALIAGRACVFSPGVALGAVAAKAGAAILGGPDVDSLAAALRRLIHDAGARAELSRRAVDFAQAELSAEVMGRRLRGMYESILSGTP